jgi:hypothetical protein
MGVPVRALFVLLKTDRPQALRSRWRPMLVAQMSAK